MVIPRAEADFDHRSSAWLAERHAHTAELRQQCPVVWNRQYGGYWFVAGHDEVSAVAPDTETFSHLFDTGRPRRHQLYRNRWYTPAGRSPVNRHRRSRG